MKVTVMFAVLVCVLPSYATREGAYRDGLKEFSFEAPVVSREAGRSEDVVALPEFEVLGKKTWVRHSFERDLDNQLRIAKAKRLERSKNPLSFIADRSAAEDLFYRIVLFSPDGKPKWRDKDIDLGSGVHLRVRGLLAWRLADGSSIGIKSLGHGGLGIVRSIRW